MSLNLGIFTEQHNATVYKISAHAHTHAHAHTLTHSHAHTHNVHTPHTLCMPAYTQTWFIVVIDSYSMLNGGIGHRVPSVSTEMDACTAGVHLKQSDMHNML